MLEAELIVYWKGFLKIIDKILVLSPTENGSFSVCSEFAMMNIEYVCGILQLRVVNELVEITPTLSSKTPTVYNYKKDGTTNPPLVLLQHIVDFSPWQDILISANHIVHTYFLPLVHCTQVSFLSSWIIFFMHKYPPCIEFE